MVLHPAAPQALSGICHCQGGGGGGGGGGKPEGTSLLGKLLHSGPVYGAQRGL